VRLGERDEEPLPHFIARFHDGVHLYQPPNPLFSSSLLLFLPPPSPLYSTLTKLGDSKPAME